MKIITNLNQLKNWVIGKQIGFIPTMGNLHNGHIALIKKAKKKKSFIVVSIFVNPKQFGPKEDFKSYPRTFTRDKDILAKEEVDVLFYPSAKDMYQPNIKYFKTYIGNKYLENLYCGKYRAGFFNGVLLVVLKLFNLVKPVDAYFGKKDYQQFILIKQMVNDLNLDINVCGVAIKRTPGGLALSSRNQYLTLAEQQDAEYIYHCLKTAKHAVHKKEITSVKILLNRVKNLLKKNSNIKTQYIEVVNKTTLQRTTQLKKSIILFAGFYGKVRLIDNIEI